jgi:hypothetical protein
VSYRSLLKHRCTLLQIHETKVGGLPGATWVAVATNLPCFLNLGMVRKGKDPVWTPESGRPNERSGVLFLHPKVNGVLRSGMRVDMQRGPSGTFQVVGAVDEAWTPTRLHHMECGVEEIGSPLAKGHV